jgi:hypothetical protein
VVVLLEQDLLLTAQGEGQLLVRHPPHFHWISRIQVHVFNSIHTLTQLCFSGSVLTL